MKTRRQFMMTRRRITIITLMARITVLQIRRTTLIRRTHHKHRIVIRRSIITKRKKNNNDQTKKRNTKHEQITHDKKTMIKEYLFTPTYAHPQYNWPHGKRRFSTAKANKYAWCVCRCTYDVPQQNPIIEKGELLNVQKQATNTHTEKQRIKNIICNQKRKQHQFANRERLPLYALKPKNKAQRANSQTAGRGRPWQC